MNNAVGTLTLMQYTEIEFDVTFGGIHLLMFTLYPLENFSFINTFSYFNV